MAISISDWKRYMCVWAEIYNGSCKVKQFSSVGNAPNYYTLEVTIKIDNFSNVKIYQNGGGTDFEVGLSYLMFEHNDPKIYNFDLFLYPNDFLNRIFARKKLKTGNKVFDKKFDITTGNKQIALAIFSDKSVQELFLTNRFLVFNVQKKEPRVFLKSMERKLYEKEEIQLLLEKFVYILQIIQRHAQKK